MLQICDVSPLRKHPKTSPIGILLCFSYDSIYFAEVFGKSTGLENIRISQMHSWIAACVPVSRLFLPETGGNVQKYDLFLGDVLLREIFVKSLMRRKSTLGEKVKNHVKYWSDENGTGLGDHTDLSPTSSMLHWAVEIFHFLKHLNEVCLIGKFSAFSKWPKFPHFKLFSKNHLPVKIYVRVSFITPNILFSQKYVINGNIFSSTEVHFKGAVPP